MFHYVYWAETTRRYNEDRAVTIICASHWNTQTKIRNCSYTKPRSPQDQTYHAYLICSGMPPCFPLMKISKKSSLPITSSWTASWLTTVAVRREWCRSASSCKMQWRVHQLISIFYHIFQTQIIEKDVINTVHTPKLVPFLIIVAVRSWGSPVLGCLSKMRTPAERKTGLLKGVNQLKK